MKSKGSSVTHQLKCIAALPFNHHFASDVARLRLKYNIPDEPKEAEVYVRKLERQDFARELARMVSEMSPEEVSKLDDGVAGLLKRRAREEGKNEDVEDIIKTIESSWSIPQLNVRDFNDRFEVEIVNANTSHTERDGLKKDIESLLADYGLPYMMAIAVRQYLVTKDKSWLSIPKTEPFGRLSIDLGTGSPTFQIIVSGIVPLLTKKQWDEIWNEIIRPQFVKMKSSHGLEHKSLMLARKRTTVKSYASQMKRWSEWYQVSEIEGQGPSQALALWEEKYPKQRGKYDVSTVTKAVRDFREIITPQPVHD